MTSITPIRNLVLMLHEASERQHAVDVKAREMEHPHTVWAPNSRVWSRQIDALNLAIIAEPPRTADDALAVLIALTDQMDVVESADAPSDRAARDLAEMTAVAVRNCAIALAATIRPEQDATETQERNLTALAHHRAVGWLPHPTAAVEGR